VRNSEAIILAGDVVKIPARSAAQLQPAGCRIPGSKPGLSDEMPKRKSNRKSERQILSGIDSRHFLAVSMGAGLIGAAPAWASSSTSKLTVLLNEPIGTISPDLYGYLVENLGTVIYDGIWVGEHSTIPNIGGIRKALVEHLRRIKASVFRWPGGNFADYYDWRDGIGPRASRPRRTNPWSDEMPKNAPPGPQRYDPNQFGTHEFMALCQLAGGRPFLNLNIRGMSPMSAGQWVDYCNAPEGSTSLADLRKKNGSSAPFGVDYWGIGNEPWSWGGNMSAKDYAAFYRRFVEGLPTHGRDLRFVACGGPPSLTSAEWTRTFLDECMHAWRPVPIFATSIHYYTGFPLNRMYAGETIDEFVSGHDARPRPLIEPLNYDEGAWYSLLSDTLKLEDLIRANWNAVQEFDRHRTIKLMVDEWGGIFDFSKPLSPAAIHSRVVPLRDAISAALTFNVLHAHADKIVGANFTGLVNQEGGLFLAEGAKFVATPIYHVFSMYADHQAGLSLRTEVSAPEIVARYQGSPVSLPGLNASASRNGNVITLTVVNPNVSDEQDTLVELAGARIQAANVTTLSNSDIHAQNTFDHPRRVVPVPGLVTPADGKIQYTFLPASVTKLTLQIG
jgi:alpha-N-arabinofuranosidase